MAKINKKASKSVYVASDSPYTGSITLWMLRDFLDTCETAGIPQNTKVKAHRSDVGHFTGVSVSYDVDVTNEVFPPEPEPEPESESESTDES